MEQAMTPTIREQAEELAGPHSYGTPVSMSCNLLSMSGGKICSCGQAERVAGILKLMEERDTFDRQALEAYNAAERVMLRAEAAENQVIYEQERNANNIAMNAEIHHDLTVKLEAAEAKVRELEDWIAKAREVAALARDKVRSEARKAALEEAAASLAGTYESVEVTVAIACAAKAIRALAGKEP